MARRFVLAAVMLAVFGGRAAVAETREFAIHHHPCGEAVTVIAPLLSPDGSVLLQGAGNRITVRDSAASLARVAAALQAWDAAPPTYRLRLRLIMASTAKPATGDARGAEVAAPAGFPAGIFGFKYFREIGAFEAVNSDGTTVRASIGEPYLVSFTIRAAADEPERVQLAGFELSRRAGGPSGVDAVRTLLRTTVSLRVGQTAVVGAAPSERSSEALLLVMTAERLPEPAQ